MDIVVDTSVWSLVLRRREPGPTGRWAETLRAHLERRDALVAVGMILQELLSGVRSGPEFERLRQELSSVPLLAVDRATHEAAAALCNLCRGQGIAASHVDFLIAAACIEHGCPLLTADGDFRRIADHSDLVLLPPEPGPGRRN